MDSRHFKKRATSFKNAFKGLGFVFAGQPNFKIHLAAALLAVLAGFYFGINQFEWLAIVLAIFLVLVTEVLNTALELVTDGLKEHKKTERDDHLIGVSKDVAAGAVLISAGASIIVGVIIFGPRFLVYFAY